MTAKERKKLIAVRNARIVKRYVEFKKQGAGITEACNIIKDIYGLGSAEAVRAILVKAGAHTPRQYITIEKQKICKNITI